MPFIYNKNQSIYHNKLTKTSVSGVQYNSEVSGTYGKLIRLLHSFLQKKEGVQHLARHQKIIDYISFPKLISKN